MFCSLCARTETRTFSKTVSLGEDVDHLEGARKALLAHLVGGHTRDVLSLEEHLPASGFKMPVIEVEERGLAGAVRSDDGDDLALAYVAGWRR